MSKPRGMDPGKEPHTKETGGEPRDIYILTNFEKGSHVLTDLIRINTV